MPLLESEVGGNDKGGKIKSDIKGLVDGVLGGGLLPLKSYGDGAADYFIFRGERDACHRVRLYYASKYVLHRQHSTHSYQRLLTSSRSAILRGSSPTL